MYFTEFTLYKDKFIIQDLTMPHFCACPKPGPEFILQTLSHHDVFYTEFTLYKTVRKKLMIWDLALPHFCARPKPGPKFPTSYVVIFCFVDNGGIVDITV